MIAFWVAAGALSAAAAILLMFRAAQAAAHAQSADTTSMFYRRQLSEIGDLADRGLIGAEERRVAEAEAGRRLLAAADAPVEAWSTGAGRMPILLVAVGAPLLALAIYLAVGSPGMGDQPFAARLAQWRAANPESLQPPEMAAVLGKLTKERPNDPDGFRFLALAEGASSNPAGAVRALKHAVQLAPQRADLWEMLGEALMFTANGELTDDAIDAFAHTIRLDPRNIAARFQLARAKIKAGDKAAGLADWRSLLADMPPTDPRRGDLQGAIAQAEGQAPPPPAAPQGLSGDQMTAVRGMVANLAARLAQSPDDPPGWVQLVKAYAVLGDTEKRDAALKSARARYAGKAEVLDALSKAAATEPMK
ncbi:MAG TPA: c-type cytochrome biogenesis protein CcmI [Phenylobacterium sp.]|jgi:cytochrome c-type biogenesis protein CcmH|uniref:c-type cytochrome biogenesis protein CcmI n=1 Tax=Phenylobacterium sp. TaxID=1871053 RepID=UPI002C209E75|nr:c-type cytochrome biogenesis protein CcmI [Phenylobacterium sp.]HXA41107.1 c-type cytochrome biogenesis protein CcmI [Phenylobacterium sp.]